MLQKSRQKDCEKGCAEQEEEQVVGDLYNLHGGPPHLWGVFKLGLWKEADFVAVLPDLVKFRPGQTSHCTDSFMMILVQSIAVHVSCLVPSSSPSGKGVRKSNQDTGLLNFFNIL